MLCKYELINSRLTLAHNGYSLQIANDNLIVRHNNSGFIDEYKFHWYECMSTSKGQRLDKDC